MKKVNLFALSILAALLTSCEAIAGIFKAGFNTGVVIVLLVIVLVIVGVFKMFGGGSKN